MSTRRELTKRMIISYGQYVTNHDARRNTTFRVLPSGQKGYLVDDKLISEDEFKKKYPLPERLHSGNSESADGTKKYLTP